MTKPKQKPRIPIEPINEQQAKKEREALKKVKLRSFTATPPSIAPFGQSTLQWDVTVPPSGDPLIDIAVYLDDEGVSPTGSRKVAPNFTRTFQLKAAGEFVSRLLGKAQVTVDLGACQVQDVAPVVFSAVTKPQIDALFDDNPNMKLKDGGSTVALGRFIVDISIPLEIEVPGWFNADMDISLKFRLFASDRVRAILNDVSVDVSWSILEHLASLGCTGVVQAALEKQAEVFLRNLMGASMAAQLAGAVQSDVNARLANLNARHPPHPFRLHSMEVSDVGISYRFCQGP